MVSCSERSWVHRQLLIGWLTQNVSVCFFIYIFSPFRPKQVIELSELNKQKVLRF